MKTTRFLSSTAIALSLLMGAAAIAADVPAGVKAAVSDAKRPAADTERDANRKPAEVVAFAGIKAGDKVADINPGGGYFTRIFSKVVGSNGKVYGVVSATTLASRPQAGDAVKAIAADAAYGNVVFHPIDYDKLTTPEPLDVAWTSLNYHDFKNRPAGFTDAMNKAVFAALKPGGIYIVIDHVAEKGSGGRDTSALHRVDPELVKQEVLAAGFKLEAESNVLAHPADDHKVGVNDSNIRGKTDQFVFKFRKP
jgi:predicted methyltransferase